MNPVIRHLESECDRLQDSKAEAYEALRTASHPDIIAMWSVQAMLSGVALAAATGSLDTLRRIEQHTKEG